MDKENFLVSVIMPTFNRADFIRKGINSCFEQMEDGIELIVVDDGSRDNTKDVVQELQTKWGVERLHYVFQENKGVSEARNTGIARAKGRYIQFLDSDDSLAPGKFEAQIHVLEQSQCPIAVSDFCFVDTEGKTLRQEVVQRDVQKVLSNIGFLNLAVYLIRASSIPSDLRFNTEMDRYEDADFMFRYFSRISDWEYCRGFFVFYLQHEGERLNRFGDVEKPLREYRAFFKSIYQDWKKNFRSIPRNNRWMIREAAKKTASRLYAGGDFRGAWRISALGLLPPFEKNRVQACVEIFVRASIRLFFGIKILKQKT